MSEFNFLTGRKELFDNAPHEAMVVLETHDGQIYYAVSHNRGARYWYDNGNPGRPAGLIPLFENTRVIASRALVAGLPPEQPKRDPIPKSRLDRMQQAQNGLKKAINQPAPVKADPPKVTPKRKTPNVGCPKCGVIGTHACMGAPVAWTEQDKQRLNEAVKKINESESKPTLVTAGFVSIFSLGDRRSKALSITVHSSGNIILSAALPLHMGDRVDAQLDPARGLFRIGKVPSGGYVLTKARCLSSKPLFGMLKRPEGKKSVCIQLEEFDGWWQGQV